MNAKTIRIVPVITPLEHCATFGVVRPLVLQPIRTCLDPSAIQAMRLEDRVSPRIFAYLRQGVWRFCRPYRIIAINAARDFMLSALRTGRTPNPNSRPGQGSRPTAGPRPGQGPKPGQAPRPGPNRDSGQRCGICTAGGGPWASGARGDHSLSQSQRRLHLRRNCRSPATGAKHRLPTLENLERGGTCTRRNGWTALLLLLKPCGVGAVALLAGRFMSFYLTAKSYIAY